MQEIDDLINNLIASSGSSSIKNCILHINNPSSADSYKSAFGRINGSELINSEFCFRIGSITKVFTATLILQFLEEDVFKLEDSFLDHMSQSNVKILSKLLYYKDVNCSSKITIKDLLRHTSGIPDYFSEDSRFIDYVMDFPEKQWFWQDIIHKFFDYGLNKKGKFKSGNGFHYSDTNYLILAVLLEDISNLRFHEVLEERILKPLSLNQTYLEYFQEPKTTTPIITPSYNFSGVVDINTSFDWGGGGLVSSSADLDNFIRSLTAGKLFKNANTFLLMSDFVFPFSVHDSKRRDVYGMGLQYREYSDYNFIGHNSAYGGMMFYDQESDVSIILSINQFGSTYKAEWIMKKIINILFT